MLKLIWNNQIGKPGTDRFFITKVKYCLLFHCYLFLYSYLLFMYIPANLLACQRCWHIKINLSLLIYLIKLKLVSAIFYQIFIYHQMIAFQKIWKMFFISSKKLFSFSRYSSFCIFIFSFFPCQPLLQWLIQEKS